MCSAACVRVRTAAMKLVWHQQNREQSNAATRRWYAANTAKSLAKWHRRRACELAGGVAVWPQVEGQPCSYCGDPATVIDHVVPLSRGGTNELANLAPACAPCNGSKGAKLLSEWTGRHTG